MHKLLRKRNFHQTFNHSYSLHDVCSLPCKRRHPSKHFYPLNINPARCHCYVLPSSFYLTTLSKHRSTVRRPMTCHVINQKKNMRRDLNNSLLLNSARQFRERLRAEISHPDNYYTSLCWQPWHIIDRRYSSEC